MEVDFACKYLKLLHWFTILSASELASLGKLLQSARPRTSDTVPMTNGVVDEFSSEGTTGEEGCFGRKSDFLQYESNRNRSLGRRKRNILTRHVCRYCDVYGVHAQEFMIQTRASPCALTRLWIYSLRISDGKKNGRQFWT